jgi:hypothetical protein
MVVAIDTKTHKIYLAAVDYAQATEAPPSGTPSGKLARPQPVPNSFKVLVCGIGEK